MKTISTPGHFVESTSAGVLHLIQERGVNLCIWQRDENPLLLSYVDFLLKKKSFSLELNSQNRSEWRSLLPEDTDIESVQAFSEELETLADLFEAISSQVLYRIHLSSVDTMQCPLFHVDYVSMRMLCTYRGNGTLWVPNSNVDRSHLGCGRNDHLLKSLTEIRQANPFDVLVFKGERNETDPGNGLVHKSPEIKGKKRFVLRIDAHSRL